MEIPLWRSVLFFGFIFILSVVLFPSQRELGLLYFDSKLVDRASFYLTKQYKIDPDDIRNTVRYLEALSYQGDLETVEKIGTKLIQKFPNDINLHNFLANFYEDNLMLDKASLHWHQILRLDNSFEGIKNKLLSFYILFKHNDALIDFYEMQQKRGQTDISDLYELGRLYALTGQDKKEQALYWNILKDHPHEKDAQLRLISLYQSKRDTGSVFSLYRRIISQYPQEEQFMFDYIEQLLNNGQPQEALALLYKLHIKNSGDYRVINIMANEYLEEKDYSSAKTLLEEFLVKNFGIAEIMGPGRRTEIDSKALQKLLENSENNFNVIGTLADVYIELQNYQQALLLLKVLGGHDPDNSRIQIKLGEMYYQMKDVVNAQSVLRRCHEKQLGNYHSHHVLGDVYAALGNTSASQWEYRTALQLIRAAK